MEKLSIKEILDRYGDNLSKEDIVKIVSDYEAEVEKTTVPKEKLAKESFLERVQWWYRDNQPLVKVGFWIILSLISIFTGISVEELSSHITEVSEDISNIIIMITALTATGTIGYASTRNPKK